MVPDVPGLTDPGVEGRGKKVVGSSKVVRIDQSTVTGKPDHEVGRCLEEHQGVFGFEEE